MEPTYHNHEYDLIIAGAGCAGLSLLVNMIRSGKFLDKKILLIDKEEKKRNDRTWCFWETSPGPFEELVEHRWDKVWFHGEEFSSLLNLAPYEYKLIRGINFYNYCFEIIKTQANIDMRFGEVGQISGNPGDSFVSINGEKIYARYIFNSIVFQKPVLQKNEYWLLQHFKGWLIETEQPVFNPGEATLMDFRVGQQKGPTFTYIMPFSTTRALVEYTLFTKEVLEPSGYDEGLRDYIRTFLKIDSYRVVEEEYGVIPMTNYRFPAHEGNIIHIGTAGGQTKASSGYTFSFIQKHTAGIVEKLVKGEPPVLSTFKKRFQFYDSTLLQILAHNTLPAHQIFARLFKKNKPRDVLGFLNNESSWGEEIKIISSLPTWPFMKAAIKQL